MRVQLLVAAFLFLILPAYAQKTDSLLQVQWESALKKLKAEDYNDASVQLTQLINSGFSNKEVYVKRGVASYRLKDYQKAKSDFDEAVKSRINTAELFEYRGNTKYNLDDYEGAATTWRKR
jgi:tetratricopeptide (TPR) repeat protein